MCGCDQHCHVATKTNCSYGNQKCYFASVTKIYYLDSKISNDLIGFLVFTQAVRIRFSASELKFVGLHIGKQTCRRKKLQHSSSKVLFFSNIPSLKYKEVICYFYNGKFRIDFSS